jgi:hypothetical protein
MPPKPQAQQPALCFCLHVSVHACIHARRRRVSCGPVLSRAHGQGCSDNRGSQRRMCAQLGGVRSEAHGTEARRTRHMHGLEGSGECLLLVTVASGCEGMQAHGRSCCELLRGARTLCMSGSTASQPDFRRVLLHVYTGQRGKRERERERQREREREIQRKIQRACALNNRKRSDVGSAAALCRLSCPRMVIFCSLSPDFSSAERPRSLITLSNIISSQSYTVSSHRCERLTTSPPLALFTCCIHSGKRNAVYHMKSRSSSASP